MNDTVEGELTVLIDSAGPLGSVGKVLRLMEISFEKAASIGSVELIGLPSVSDLLGNELRVVGESVSIVTRENHPVRP